MPSCRLPDLPGLLPQLIMRAIAQQEEVDLRRGRQEGAANQWEVDNGLNAIDW